MTNLKDNEITIYDEDGNERLMYILFTYESQEREAKYAFVYEKDKPEDVFVMKYNDNNEMFVVEDEEELAEAEEVLNTYNEDPKIQEIKD